ncbi:family 11 glycosyl hydrolase [Coprinopsis sp. MPI-PUGE-AT-0042]|nr:family 11 glycosyl hydrolase [Coprinopsis sp. MPI-PUGE-AT-0042]
MVSFKSLFVAVSAAVCAIAAPSANLTARGATYTNGARGNYVCVAEGWNPGTANRVMTYGGNYQYSGNSYLAVYGWTRSPLIEYYIVENFEFYANSLHRRNQDLPAVLVRPKEQALWLVPVDVGAHFRAWANAGLQLGTNHYYQIMACEGYFSSGNCNITVSDGGSSTPTTSNPQPTSQNPQPTTAPNNPQPTGNCAAKWGQCGGNGWSGATCCAEGSCKASNEWYSQCV